VDIPNNVLQRLKSFLLKGGIENFIQGFRNPPFEAVSLHQAQYDPNTDTLREHHYVYSDPPFEYDIEYCTIRFFKKDLERTLNSFGVEIASAIEKIKGSKKASVSKTLRSLKNEIEDLESGVKHQESLTSYSPIFQSFFKEILSYCDIQKGEKVRALSFGFNKKDDQVLKKVYALIINGESFINKEETPWPVFEAIFTSKNIWEEDPGFKIRFDCETRTLAYILRKMESISEKINFSNIELSERFYTKRGSSPIKGTNLSKSLGKGKQPVRSKETIDKFFNNLSPKH